MLGLITTLPEVQFVPSMKVNADLETAQKVLRLLDALDDLDDVQNVYSNMDLSDRWLLN